MTICAHISQPQYYIKYKGYDHSENTWEPLENLCCPELIDEYEEKIKKRRKSGKVEVIPTYYEVEFISNKRHINGKVSVLNLIRCS